RHAGHLDEVSQADGSVKITLDVLENGRGPHSDAVARFASDGSLQSFESSGHHEMGNKSFEKYKLEDGVATWDGSEEHGKADVPDLAFYNPLSEVPMLSHIVTAAL